MVKQITKQQQTFEHCHYIMRLKYNTISCRLLVKPLLYQSINTTVKGRLHVLELEGDDS